MRVCTDYGIESSIDENLGKKVIRHRNSFFRMMRGRYFELLPSIITYTGLSPMVRIPVLELEDALRSGNFVAIGETSLGTIQVLGTVKSDPVPSPFQDMKFHAPMTEENINFSIPVRYRLPNYRQITPDAGHNGNFVILRNKYKTFVSDYEIVEYYIDELAEITASRYSLSIQAKLLSFFKGVEGDESLSKVITDLYNGVPFVKITPAFDPDTDIIQMDGTSLAANFAELKREYQNKITELNSLLGIYGQGIDKESGVSDAESKSNAHFVTMNSNIYLESRNQPLAMLNRVFGTKIQAVFNDRAMTEENRSELPQKIQEKEEGAGDTDNNFNPDSTE